MIWLCHSLSGVETLHTAPESRGLRIDHDRARAACLARGGLHGRPALSLRAAWLRRHGLSELVVRRGRTVVERRVFTP